MSFRLPAASLTVSLLATAAIGCGGGTTTVTSTPTETQTATETVTEPAAEASTTSTSAQSCIRVPNVVGRNHQAAQNAMQAAGLYMLDEEDATGQGRALIWDRNWQVVRQSPAAGKCVSEDTTILLSSKKIGE